MQKTTEQLQADLDREKAYTQKINRQIDRLRDQLRNTISLSEHERILAFVRRECETKLSEIKIQQARPYQKKFNNRSKALQNRRLPRRVCRAFYFFFERGGK